MSSKKAKKARKIYRQQFEEKYGKLTEEMAKENSRLLRPKPVWFPMFLWIRILRIFVKIK